MNRSLLVGAAVAIVFLLGDRGAAQESAVDGLEHWRLQSIVLTAKRQDASLFAPWQSYFGRRLSLRLGYDRLNLRNEAGDHHLQKSKLLRVESDRVYFEYAERIHALELGQSVKDALAHTVASVPAGKPFVPESGRISVRFANATWTHVLENFSDNTGLRVIAEPGFPKGTFSYKPPLSNGVPPTPTLAELARIYQAQLADKGHKLVSWKNAFLVLDNKHYDARLEGGELLKVGIDGYYFRADGRVYFSGTHGRIGATTFAGALARPLTPKEVDKAGLK